MAAALSFNNVVLRDLYELPAQYNTYFARLSDGEEPEPPATTNYTAKELVDWTAFEIAAQDKADVCTMQVYNDIMCALKVGLNQLDINKDPITFCIGGTRGGYGS